MNKPYLKLIIVLALSLLVAGCGTYNKLLKSTDYDKIYTHALKYFHEGKYGRTIQLTSMLEYAYVGTEREDSVVYYKATAHYKKGELMEAAEMFDAFRKTYNRSVFLEDVEYMYAKSFYYMSPEPNRDQTMTKQALLAMNEYLERYPNSVKRDELVKNVQELTLKLHDKAFVNAELYYKTRKYKAAVHALKNALGQYPESKHAEEMMYLIVKSSYLLAENSVVNLQRDRYLNVVDYYYNFISEYKESTYSKELKGIYDKAQRYLAQFEENKEEDNI